MPEKAKLGPSYCPSCYLADGIDTELPAPRAGATYKCPRGHSWDDIGNLQIQQDLARHKRSQMAPKDPANAPSVTTIPLAAQVSGNEIVICDSDKKRIVDLIGADFVDGSSLFGSIYSLMQDMKTLEEELAIAKKAPEPSAITSLNSPAMRSTKMEGLPVTEAGDLPVTILIPEKYVGPLLEVVTSNDTTIPEFMNMAIANGLEGGWFF